jgi:transcriptional regulator with XRE-family HTH domain
MEVKESREMIGVSQRELADRTGISQATLSRIESGVREATEGELSLIAIALDVEKVEAKPRREQYLSAPKDPKERREWFAWRNRRIQEIGPKPVDGVTFAKKA